jgi:hypothetical protein
MHYLSAVLLAAGATAVLAIGAAAQAKQQHNAHVMSVQLPFGGVETIHYQGDVAPTVTTWSGFLPGSAAFDDPLLAGGSFARVSQAMDREMAALRKQIEALQRGAPASNGVFNAAAGPGGGYCAETVQITQTGDGPAHVVRHSYGDCGAATAGAVQTRPSPPANGNRV